MAIFVSVSFRAFRGQKQRVARGMHLGYLWPSIHDLLTLCTITEEHKDTACNQHHADCLQHKEPKRFIPSACLCFDNIRYTEDKEREGKDQEGFLQACFSPHRQK